MAAAHTLEQENYKAVVRDRRTPFTDVEGSFFSEPERPRQDVKEPALSLRERLSEGELANRSPSFSPLSPLDVSGTKKRTKAKVVRSRKANSSSLPAVVSDDASDTTLDLRTANGVDTTPGPAGVIHSASSVRVVSEAERPEALAHAAISVAGEVQSKKATIEKEAPTSPEKDKPKKTAEEEIGWTKYNAEKKLETWRHGIIEFKNTGWHSKYIIVPEDCESGEELLAVMTWLWKLELPKLVVNIEGAEAHFKDFGTDIVKWDNTGEMLSHTTDGKPKPNKQQECNDQVDWTAKRIASKVEDIASGVISACAECGGWLVNRGHGRSAVCPDTKSFVVEGKTALMSEAMKKYNKKQSEGQAVSMIYTCFESVFGHNQLWKQGAWLDEEVENKVLYPHKNWIDWDGNIEKADRTVPDGELKDSLYKKLSDEASLTPGNSLAAFCATHIILYQTTDRSRVRDFLADGLDRVGICSTQVYLHGDYSLRNKIVKEASTNLVILLKGTGGATDICAEAHDRLAPDWLQSKRPVAGPASGTSSASSDASKEGPASNTQLHFPSILPSRAAKVKSEKKEHPKTSHKEDGASERMSVTPAIAGTLSQLAQKTKKTPKFTISDLLENRDNIKVCDITNCSLEGFVDTLLLFMNLLQDDHEDKIGEKANDAKRLKQAGEIWTLYYYNSRTYYWCCNLLEASSAMISALTTIASVLITYGLYLENDRSAGNWGILPNPSSPAYLQIFWVAGSLLPVIATFLLTISEALRPRLKWAQLVNAANRIETAIWKFRTRVSEYNVKKDYVNAKMLHQGPHGKVVKKIIKRASSEEGAAEAHARLGESSLTLTDTLARSSPTQGDGRRRRTDLNHAADEDKEKVSVQKPPRRLVFQQVMNDVQTLVRTSELRACSVTNPHDSQRKKRLQKKAQDTRRTTTRRAAAGVPTSSRNLFEKDATRGSTMSDEEQAIGHINDSEATESIDDSPSLANSARKTVSGLQHQESEPGSKNKIGKTNWEPWFCCRSRAPEVLYVAQSADAKYPEEYIDERVLERLHHFEKLAPKLSRSLAVLRVLLILATSINAVLAIMPEKRWIAAIVAVTVCMETIMKDQMLDQRLRAVNAAVLALENLLTWWMSLTLVERRLQENYNRLVETAEAVAYADMVWLPAAEKDGTGVSATSAKGAVEKRPPSKFNQIEQA